MLLNVFATLFLIFGVVLMLGALIMGYNLGRTRSVRGRKILSRRRRNTWLLSIGSYALAVVLFLSAFLPKYYLKELEGSVTYDLPAAYKSALASSGEEKAYAYLPARVESYDNTVAVVNERNEWFVYDLVENSEGETSRRWVNRGKRTQRMDAASLSGEQKAVVRLSVNGRLYVDGSFPYMQYDNNQKTYKGLLESKVSDFSFSGNTLMFLTDAKQLYALGLNECGQLGDASNRNKTTPTLIRSDIVQMAVGATHTMMVDDFGNLYACGDNSESQLGDGTMSNSSAPIKVLGGVKSAAVGNFFSVILAQNGDVYTCGRTAKGQCGNGTKNGTAVPFKIAEGAVKVIACDESAAYMTEDGKVYAWGANTDKMLTGDDTEFLNTPTLVAENAYDIAFGDNSLAVLTRTRDLQLSGGYNTSKKERFTTVLSMEATVPEEFISPVDQQNKPDISELGK